MVSFDYACDLLFEGESICSIVSDLIEGAGKFSCLMVPIPKHIARHMKNHGKLIHPTHLAKDGVEDDHHVTVKYGLHTNDPRKVANVVRGFGPVRVKLGKTSLFRNPDADVLKVHVHSPDLHKLNAYVVNNMKHTDTFKGYKPHATIAYVKPGLGAQYAKQHSVEGHEFIAHHVIFSDRNKTHHIIQL